MIRPATLADLDAIAEIDRHAFPRPWPRATFEAELERSVRGELANASEREYVNVGRLVVLVERDRVVAYCNYWVVTGEVHILAIATHPDHRRGGLGARLVAHALAEGRRSGCTLATLEVRRSNAPAIALYERAGFATVHVRKRYYIDNDEDALVMTASLAAT